jgi:hypothetical protein
MTRIAKRINNYKIKQHVINIKKSCYKVSVCLNRFFEKLYIKVMMYYNLFTGAEIKEIKQ